jgi:hypothetical protein
MWKKLLVVLAVIGLIFVATPAMADGNGYGLDYAKGCAFALNLQGQVQGMYAQPNFLAMGQAGGMVNVAAASSYTYGNGSSCSLAVAGGIQGQSQSVTAPGFSAQQSQFSAGLSVAKTRSSSFGGFDLR